ncbi:MAG: four helix bundle protein [Bacteroidales bacterium]|jgi:four helix bundle protein|nr:four helix bundle protein [Bacteroidales bacterium]
MRTKGIIYEKCKAFSLSVISLCKELEEKKEFVISNQILKSATSIGANYCEALDAESSQDFIHKISISLKEANETYYWLDLLYSSNSLEEVRFNELCCQVEELHKMLNSSIYTIRQRINTQTNELNN